MLLLTVTVGALAWILPLAAYRFNAQRMAQRFMLTELPPIPGTILAGTFAASIGVAALSMVLPRLVLALRPLRRRALQPRAGAATVGHSA